jgi:hypothetical protein
MFMHAVGMCKNIATAFTGSLTENTLSPEREAIST